MGGEGGEGRGSGGEGGGAENWRRAGRAGVLRKNPVPVPPFLTSNNVRINGRQCRELAGDFVGIRLVPLQIFELLREVVDRNRGGSRLGRRFVAVRVDTVGRNAWQKGKKR